MSGAARRARHWALAADETVLREVETDPALYRKRSGGRPRDRVIHFLIFVGLGGFVLFLLAEQLLAPDFEPTFGAITLAALRVVLGSGAIWLGFFLAGASDGPPLDTHRYVFTDRRILELDAKGRALDEIRCEEMEAITEDLRDASTTIIRFGDDALKRMFYIGYVPDFKELMAFVWRTYKTPAMTRS